MVGLSSAVLFDKENPFNPVNRRISIIVMNKKAEEAAQKDGGTVELEADKESPETESAETSAAPPVNSAELSATSPAPAMVPSIKQPATADH